VAAVPMPDLIVRQFRSTWAAARLPRGDRMKRRSRDEEREQRITMEIIVDAYTPRRAAMGWHYSLEDR
jgi:Calcium binding